MTLYIEEKYIRLLSGHVRNFKQKNRNLYNFSCPSCGDSKTDEYKARGYFFKYKNAWLYKCHNCQYNTNLYGMLKLISTSLYNDFVLEEFKESNTSNKHVTVDYDVDISKFSKDKEIRLDSILSPLSLEKSTHKAIQYLVERKIPLEKIKTLYYSDDINSLKSIFTDYQDTIFPKEDRIVIPIYDRQKKLLGVSTRAIRSSKSRYIILRHKSDVPLVYNIENLDFSETKYVLEGQFDSMFIPNSVAVSGLDMFKTFELFDSNTVYILDNQPRNRSVITAMKSVINAKKKIFIWPTKITEKDVNQAIFKYPDFSQMINKQTYSGLDAELKLIEWSKI